MTGYLADKIIGVRKKKGVVESTEPNIVMASGQLIPIRPLDNTVYMASGIVVDSMNWVQNTPTSAVRPQTLICERCGAPLKKTEVESPWKYACEYCGAIRLV